MPRGVIKPSPNGLRRASPGDCRKVVIESPLDEHTRSNNHAGIIWRFEPPRVSRRPFRLSCRRSLRHNRSGFTTLALDIGARCRWLAFAAAVDFEMFRPELTRGVGLLGWVAWRAAAIRPCDDVQGSLVIQAANTLSDERTEFLINDRLSFMRFLGLSCPTGSPTLARSGCSGRSSPGLRRSSRCSTGSTRRCARPATSPWAGKSSTLR